jgi:hypothetical protein
LVCYATINVHTSKLLLTSSTTTDMGLIIICKGCTWMFFWKKGIKYYLTEQASTNNVNNLEKHKGTQDEYKQNKNTTQYVLDTTMSKQTQIT